MTNTVELKDLVGLRKLSGVDFFLSGVDFFDEKSECEFYDSMENVCLFCLDGIVYRAKEDSEDGYRSSCREIEVVNQKIKNRFTPQMVICVYRTTGVNRIDDILDIIDVKTGKVVLSVGTENTDNYYPSFVANFQPENMAINAVKP